MTIDDAEIKRLRELCEKATPGPWEDEGGKYGPDELFIAASRTAIPALLDELVAARQLAADNFAEAEAQRRHAQENHQEALLLEAEVTRLSRHEDSTAALRTIAAMLGVESGEAVIEEIKRLKERT